MNDARIELGRSGLRVAPICIGTWQLSGAWGRDTSQAAAAVRHAFDRGLNFFDTAYAYGWGAAEEGLGRALADLIRRRRDELVIVTKGGVRPANGGYERNSDPPVLRGMIENSLRLLGTDYVDLFLIHWPDPAVAFDDTARVLEGFVRDGLARRVGVSNFSVEQMRAFAAGGRIAAVQVPYCVVRQGVERELIPHCEANGIGIMGHAALAHGLLSGSVLRGGSFAPDDWRVNAREFKGPDFERRLTIAEALAAIAAEQGCTLAELSLAWVRAHPVGVIPVVGVQRPADVDSCLRALELRLDDAVLQAIRSLGAQAPEPESTTIAIRKRAG